MNDLFSRVVRTVSEYGEILEAHLYNFSYITATVETEDGKKISFTVDIKEEDEDD